GYILFVIPSILVSISFTPILLSVAPVPAFDTTKPLSFLRLYRASPLGCVGMFLLGGVFSAQFGMSSVWGTQVGRSVRDISIYVAAIYVGGMVLQYPIGWASDRMDRRMLVVGLSAIGSLGMGIAAVFDLSFPFLLCIAALMGGISNPLYSLLVAYTNDRLDNSDMPAAAAGLIFINGLGAISGPLIAGWMMGRFGSDAFYSFIGILFGAIAIYGSWRATRRRNLPSEQSAGFTPLSPTAGVIAVEAVMDARQENVAAQPDSAAE
ncbi:MAG: MFS transporter, partial [Paracoccaceae bacterium]